MPPTFAGVTKVADDIVAKFANLESIGSVATMQNEDEVQQCVADKIDHWPAVAHLPYERTTEPKEGNDEMVIAVWRYLLPIFRMTKRKNYAIVAAHLLQLQYLSSERTKMQLKYGRFVITHNQIGKNTPCNLHMEHLNRYR